MKSNPINPYKEEKLADGIYITKYDQTEKEKANQQKYVFKSTAELINILETEFESIAEEIQMLYNANEEMLQYDPNDYDLIEARQENLEIINKKLIRLKDIQNKLKGFCPTNPLVLKDVFEYFINPEVKKEVNEITNMTSGGSNLQQEQNTEENVNTDVIMTSIDL